MFSLDKNQKFLNVSLWIEPDGAETIDDVRSHGRATIELDSLRDQMMSTQKQNPAYPLWSSYRSVYPLSCSGTCKVGVTGSIHLNWCLGPRECSTEGIEIEIPQHSYVTAENHHEYNHSTAIDNLPFFFALANTTHPTSHRKGGISISLHDFFTLEEPISISIDSSSERNDDDNNIEDAAMNTGKDDKLKRSRRRPMVLEMLLEYAQTEWCADAVGFLMILEDKMHRASSSDWSADEWQTFVAQYIQSSAPEEVTLSTQVKEALLQANAATFSSTQNGGDWVNIRNVFALAQCETWPSLAHDFLTRFEQSIFHRSIR
jgi:hypothetical protein